MQIRSKARIKLTCKMFCCFSIICWSFELDLESNIYLTVTLGNRPGDRLIKVDHLERFSKNKPIMWQIDLEVKTGHSISNLFFITSVAWNMIKVFESSEEFTPKQQILQ